LTQQGAVVVLTFHRVLSAADQGQASSLESITIRQATFRKLAQYLQQTCEVLDLSAVPASWNRPARKPRVALTFDDGWADNATTMLPVARRYGLPVTIFICPALMGVEQPFWHERVTSLLRLAAARKTECQSVTALLVATLGEGIVSPRAWLEESGRASIIELLKTKSPEIHEHLISELRKVTGALDPSSRRGDSILTWAQAENMAASGLVTFGSHTQTHKLLARLSTTAVVSELNESKHEIEKRLEKPCLTLAYPNGSFSDPVCAAAKAVGYAMAFTTKCSTWTQDTDLLRIPRTNASQDAFVGLFGPFSRLMADYTIFWRAYRASSQQPKTRQARQRGQYVFDEESSNVQLPSEG
jgi:peptidoglycan/xylan/chitin deacetylase (PgdA/CDA1 family)